MQNSLNERRREIGLLNDAFTDLKNDMEQLGQRIASLEGDQALFDSLLSELRSRMEEFEIDLAGQNGSLVELRSRLANLNASLVEVEARVSELEVPGFVKTPEYDSGWMRIDEVGQSINIVHNLSTIDAIVDIKGKTTIDGGAHQKYLGGTGYTKGWEKVYGGSGIDVAYSIVQTGDGGYALAGYTESFGAGGNDFWLVKADSDGKVQWNRTYGGVLGEYARSLIQTSDGDYVLAGRTASFGAGGWDYWLVKTDSNGNMQWNKTYGGTNTDVAYSIVQTGDGGYALAGYTESFGAGAQDFWLVKTDSNGNMQWNKTYGERGSEEAYALVRAIDGGYAIAGHGKPEVSPFGKYNVWLVKTDSGGNMQWSRVYGGTEIDTARSMVQTVDRGYAIAGATRSFGSGGYDFWLIKVNSTGSMEWEQSYGGTDDDHAYSVIQTNDAGFAIAGYTNSFGTGNSDAWLVKVDNLGAMQWSKTYGTEAYDGAYSLVQSEEEGFLFVGNEGGAYPYLGDFWLVKTETEFGLIWIDSTLDSINLYIGRSDHYLYYVRVRIWKIKEN